MNPTFVAVFLLLFVSQVHFKLVASKSAKASGLTLERSHNLFKLRIRRQINEEEEEEESLFIAPSRNQTCSFTRSFPCQRIFRVPNCISSFPFFRCTGVRFEMRQVICNETSTRCCEGYVLGASGYCEFENSASGCGDQRVLTESSGTLTSPGYPENYVIGQKCAWTIQGPPGSKVVMTLLDLDMEDPRGSCNLREGDCSPGCIFDWLKISDGSTTKSVCGRFTPSKKYVSRSNYFRILFSSDESTVGRGFKLVYNIVSSSAVDIQRNNRTCANGQEWQLCHRKCALTCYEMYDSSSWNICMKSDNTNEIEKSDMMMREMYTCEPGCSCPSWKPVWDFKECIKIDQCNQSRFKCGLPLPIPSKKIVGGSIAQDGQWPWMAQITTNSQYPDCGATLVCSDWLLTAAHCFIDRITRKLPDVIDLDHFWYHLGKYWKYNQEDDRKVESFRARKIIIHPEYQPEHDLNDIALVHLDGYVVDIDRIKPICLPLELDPLIVTEEQMNNTRAKPNFGDGCITTGWGSTRNIGPDSLKLKQVVMPVRPVALCTYKDFSWRKIICAGGVLDQDTCKGDSGGPFMCRHGKRWFIDGVTSFGEGCATTTPGGYSRVGHYIPWIRKHIGPHCGNP